GVINIDANERNGDVVGMKLVADDDEAMLITEKGILIRTRVDQIRETGRNAAGVRLIKLDEGDKLVAMARVDAEESPKGDGETPTADGNADETGTPPTSDEDLTDESADGDSAPKK